MAVSLFLGAARAMDDFAIKQRIQSAVLFHAQSLLGAPVAPARNYAVAAVLNPQQTDPTMIALVCVSEAVASLVVASEDGGTVDTSAVTDAVILTQVQAKWALVSAKYQADPLAQAG